MAEYEEAIRVIGRFRPLNEREKSLKAESASNPPRFGDNGRTVWVGPDEATGNYALDAILPPDASHADLFVHASGLVDAVKQGYNATFLAYGQTGSGKTHSVMGSLDGDEADLGLLPRAVQKLFDLIEEDVSGAEFTVSCSYLEIYKEAVRDLLAPAKTEPTGGAFGSGSAAPVYPSLPVREAVGKGVYVEGLTEVPVSSDSDVLDCLACGNASRMVGSTLMNAQSSRSHALLQLNLRQKFADGSSKVSKLNIADLAGSEKVSKTGSSGETLDEAKKINASLSALCLVIAALSDGKPHVPYRNSKLTRILQESLGGNSKTMMLVACSPSANNAPETHSTLRFATRAKKVKNAAFVNQVLGADQLATANAALRLELKHAKERISKLERNGGGGGGGGAGGGGAGGGGGADGGDAPPEKAAASAEELEQLREQVETLEGQLEEAKLEASDEQREAATLKEQLAERSEEREMLLETLARFQVLQGVSAISKADSKRHDSKEMIDKLRRQLVDLEMIALQKEMGTLDETEASGPAAVEKLKMQLGEQARRIRELEPLAEAAAEAGAAKQEVVMLREQIASLAKSKLHSVSRRTKDSRRQSVADLTLATAGGGAKAAGFAEDALRAKEAFGQHMLKSISEGEDGEGGEGGDGGSGGSGGSAVAADARVAQLDKELQLEKSRREALERKLTSLQAVAGAAAAAPGDSGDGSVADGVSHVAREAELASGVLRRVYGIALQESEAEAQRAVRQGKVDVEEAAVATRLVSGELRRVEAEKAAIATVSAAFSTSAMASAIGGGVSSSSASVDAEPQAGGGGAGGGAEGGRKSSVASVPPKPAAPASAESIEWQDAVESPLSDAAALAPPPPAAEEEEEETAPPVAPPPARRQSSTDHDELPVALMGGLAGGWIESSKRRDKAKSKRSSMFVGPGGGSSRLSTTGESLILEDLHEEINEDLAPAPPPPIMEAGAPPRVGPGTFNRLNSKLPSKSGLGGKTSSQHDENRAANRKGGLVPPSKKVGGGLTPR